jgi:hypothetical protein
LFNTSRGREFQITNPRCRTCLEDLLPGVAGAQIVRVPPFVGMPSASKLYCLNDVFFQEPLTVQGPYEYGKRLFGIRVRTIEASQM